MLPCHQVLTLSGDICALRPAWLLLSIMPATGELQDRVQKRGAVKALGDLPGRGGASKPLRGPHQELHPLYFQLSPEFQAPTSSFLLLWRGWRRCCLLGGLWWGFRDFFLLPILSTAGQDTERVRRCPGNPSIHSIIHSFKAVHWGPTPCLARSGWCCGHSDELLPPWVTDRSPGSGSPEGSELDGGCSRGLWEPQKHVFHLLAGCVCQGKLPGEGGM